MVTGVGAVASRSGCADEPLGEVVGRRPDARLRRLRRRSTRRRAGGRSRSRRGTSAPSGYVYWPPAAYERSSWPRAVERCSPSHRPRCSSTAGTNDVEPVRARLEQPEARPVAGRARERRRGRTAMGTEAASTARTRSTARLGWTEPVPSRARAITATAATTPAGETIRARQPRCTMTGAPALAGRRRYGRGPPWMSRSGARARRLVEEEPRQSSLEVGPVGHACSLPDDGSRASASSVARSASIA